MTVVTKAKGGREDLNFYDGVTKTFTRLDSTGGTQTITKFGNQLDVLHVYGSGTNLTRNTLETAIRAVGTSTNIVFYIAPGTWTIDADITFPQNVALFFEHGAYFDDSSGATITYNGPVLRHEFEIANIAQLRKIDQTILPSGKAVFVRASATDGDHAGGFYYYDTSDTTTADDGINTIVATDGARWKRIQITNYLSGNNFTAGQDSMTALTSGVNNIAVGCNVLAAVTTGSCLIAIGNNALTSNVTSSQIIAIGHNTLTAATGANCSVGIGFNVLPAATTGNFNTVVGNNAMQCTTTGQCNVAMGRDALVFNTSGTCLTAIGLEAGQQNTTGCSNTFLGMEAGRCNTTGCYNIAIGASTMLGSSSGITGLHNFAAGCIALNSLTTGSCNIGIGRQAGGSVNTGINNVVLGPFSGFSLTSGADNIFIGERAGNDTQNGDANIYIGKCAGYSAKAAGCSNIYIGNNVGATTCWGTNGVLAIDAADVTNPLIFAAMCGSNKRFIISGEMALANGTEDVASGGRLGVLSTTEVTTLSGSTTDTTVTVPSGAMLLGAQFTVDTAVVDDAGDDTWSAAFNGGSSTSLASGAAAAQNTKVNTLVVPEIASSSTVVRFTPNGGNFTAGAIEVTIYYMILTSMGDA